MLFIYSALAHEECWDSLATTMTGLHTAWSRNRDSIPSSVMRLLWTNTQTFCPAQLFTSIATRLHIWSTTAPVSGCQKETSEKRQTCKQSVRLIFVRSQK